MFKRLNDHLREHEFSKGAVGHVFGLDVVRRECMIPTHLRLEHALFFESSCSIEDCTHTQLEYFIHLLIACTFLIQEVVVPRLRLCMVATEQRKVAAVWSSLPLRFSRCLIALSDCVFSFGHLETRDACEEVSKTFNNFTIKNQNRAPRIFGCSQHIRSLLLRHLHRRQKAFCLRAPPLFSFETFSVPSRPSPATLRLFTVLDLDNVCCCWSRPRA